MIKFTRYSFLVFTVLVLCSWGFYAHKTINRNAVYLLPSELSTFFILHIDEIEANAVNADKRRYTDTTEACKHYIDLDLYGDSPFDSIPKKWFDAKRLFTADTLKNRGILPWVIQWEYTKLVWAMDSGTVEDVIKSAADLGHYVADACVPLHTTSNYNGQFTGQKGVHALWESRIPESFSWNYDYYIGKSVYLGSSLNFAWSLVKESNALVNPTLSIEGDVSKEFTKDEKYRLDNQNGKIVHQYTNEFISQYNLALDSMVERRLLRSIFAISSLWYSAWVDAGQPDLHKLKDRATSHKMNIKRDFSLKRIHE